jgi:hypothetical protein
MSISAAARLKAILESPSYRLAEDDTSFMETGAPSIGFNIRMPAEQLPNPYITPELALRFHYFALRKMHFLLRARALVFFPRTCPSRARLSSAPADLPGKTASGFRLRSAASKIARPHILTS